MEACIPFSLSPERTGRRTSFEPAAEPFQLLSPAKVWNALAANVVSASSIDPFQHQLQNFSLFQQTFLSVPCSLNTYRQAIIKH